MKQTRAHGNRTNRNQGRTNRRQTVQSPTANHAADQPGRKEVAVPVAEAARLLGVDARTIRRMCAGGRLQSFVTPGGHRRVALADIEAIQSGDADPSQSYSGRLQSPTVQQKKERLEELHLTIQEKKAQMALRELEHHERERAEEEEAARRAEEQEARRVRREIEGDRARRDRERENADAEARAAQARQEWETDWLRIMLGQLPPDVPPQLKLDVADAVRGELLRLYEMSGHAEDLVEAALRIAAERSLYPWKRSKEAARAADEAVNQLPLFARCTWGQPNEWELRAREQALCAIMALPEAATLEQMMAVARSAGRRIGQEYEHQEAQARARCEGEQTRVRLEADVEMHLSRVLPYLAELEADPEGWDFEGELFEYLRRIEAAIRPYLIEELPLDFTAGQRRVEELVDKWLAEHT